MNAHGGNATQYKCVNYFDYTGPPTESIYWKKSWMYVFGISCDFNAIATEEVYFEFDGADNVNHFQPNFSMTIYSHVNSYPINNLQLQSVWHLNLLNMPF